MVHDKTWLENRNRSSSEYLEGLEKFVDMAKDYVDSAGMVYCPCVKCQNTLLHPHKRIRAHLHAWGFDRHYTRWIYHGESYMNSPDNNQVEVTPLNDMAGVIEDLMQGVTNQGEGNSGSHHDEENLGEESNGVGDGFDDLLKEVEAELYPGSKFNSLDFLANLMHIKVKNKWTNTSVDELFKLLRDSHPEGNRIPDSHNEAKKILKKVGLGYESIHVCKNDCALFWREHESLQNCPVCNESRWVDKNTKGKKVAHKVLRYFPLEPRLRRL